MFKKIALLFCFFSLTLSITPAFADYDYGYDSDSDFYKECKSGTDKAKYTLTVLRNGIVNGKEEALSALEYAAERGCSLAQRELSYMYGYGIGVGIDNKKASYWSGQSKLSGE